MWYYSFLIIYLLAGVLSLYNDDDDDDIEFNFIIILLFPLEVEIFLLYFH